MKISVFLVTIFLSVTSLSYSQIDAKLMRYLDMSKDKIAFVYGGDIWIMPRSGGQAIQLTHSQGEESDPRFSPDGSEIAYSASYNGNMDIYVMPVEGGIPKRLTYASFPDRMLDWHPDGKSLMIASRREAKTPRVNEFFMLDVNGGLPTKLDIPYGELAKFNSDGSKLVYITKITENYPFKRYRGGLTSDILVYDFKTSKVDRITTDHANDGKPTWSGNNIYYLSDVGANYRRNIYQYNTQTKVTTPLTSIEDFDITYFAVHNDDLVFESGGDLYVKTKNANDPKKIEVKVVSDLSLEMPQLKNVSDQLRGATPSPDGNRLVVEARGELFNIPAKEGVTINLTHSSGAYDRNAAWSPDGRHIAYWSDKGGEFQIYLQDSKNTKAAKRLTDFKSGFGYELHWSPDSQHMAFIDEQNRIRIVNAESGKITDVDKNKYHIIHGGRFGYTLNWSPDSKWLTYSKSLDNSNGAIYLYNVDSKKVTQVTSGFYNDFNPVFDSKGEFLFYLTDRAFNAAYSSLGDGTWIYPNNTEIVALALNRNVQYPLSPKNDTISISKDQPKEKEGDSKKEVPSSDTKKELKIDLNGAESRLTVLPIPAGNYGDLFNVDGKLIYLKYPIVGDFDGNSTLKYFDFDKREEKKIMDNINSVIPTANGKSMLVFSRGKLGIISPSEGQKIDEPVPTGHLTMQWVAKEEWREIFNDTWRRYRDFFYDKDMQQVDWDEMRERYGKLIEDARTRWDVSNIQSNMQAELSAGHTYTRGGDNEQVNFIQTGYLGINWKVDSKGYAIEEIIKPAPWDTEVRSPFDRPGIEVSSGDYIHSVNGIPLDTKLDPYAAFDGLAGQTVALQVSKSGKISEAKEVIVKLLNQGEEQNLRYLSWIEDNRQMVEKLSDGKLGYVYMSNTSSRGQLELVKMYYAQLDKQGFIIDERFNGGGQLADRFMELMLRPSIYNLYWRHGEHITAPQRVNTGPKGMLINGWAGSGGDALPWAFRELDAGPIVGERTVGILVGPATGHELIDGGGITVPGARLYLNNGEWFDEGVGVRPDIEVWDDPNLLMEGKDPQIERVVSEVLKLVMANPPIKTPPPSMQDRTAKGLQTKD
ncbi:S41 family peptidase [Aegicerativicinus sediminis]|uniref:S41 family peptidase n=1 Tax=Aegicerativicinus sediminis TaxID=2893202 RepID=UPI001E381365|nr:S41 family peptidase [Aegicerativicinus sediminis]